MSLPEQKQGCDHTCLMGVSEDELNGSVLFYI